MISCPTSIQTPVSAAAESVLNLVEHTARATSNRNLDHLICVKSLSSSMEWNISLDKRVFFLRMRGALYSYCHEGFGRAHEHQQWE